MIKPAPLSFLPYLKNVIWGGCRISEYKGMPDVGGNIGESWEISALEGHESVVKSGEYKGYPLSRLTEEFGISLLGKGVYDEYEGKFPLLVKLIDTKDNVSVQVHPDDRIALERHGCPGKTEMWYIINATDGAKIYAGLAQDLTPDQYEKAVEDGNLMEMLSEFESSPGDVYFLPAGTIHAIGAGNLMVEIQQSSDITYRIFDYGRRDKDGNKRDLHTGLAKEAINYNKGEGCKKKIIYNESGATILAECEHFTTSLVRIKGERDFDFDSDSFTVLNCVEGEALLKYAGGENFVKTGDTLLLPAVLSSFSLIGNATFLITKP